MSFFPDHDEDLVMKPIKILILGEKFIPKERPVIEQNCNFPKENIESFLRNTPGK